jgi:hypothetical protein
MGWGYGYRNSGIYQLRNYEKALDKFETTTPIRNPKRTVECRPLGHRDRPHFSIAKLDDGSIACCDYYPEHKTVVFHPDGNVTITPIWVSASTCAFIQEVTGISSTQHDHSVKINIGGAWIRVPREGLVVRRMDGGGAYELVSEVQNTIHHIKRKQANNVRSRYNEFRDYLTGFIRLRGDTRIDDEELKPLFGVEIRKYTYTEPPTIVEHVDTPRVDYSDRAKMGELFKWMHSEDHMDRYKAAMVLVVNACRWRMNESDTLEMFDRCILAYHKDEVFKEVEVGKGILTRDRYGWAFR